MGFQIKIRLRNDVTATRAESERHATTESKQEKRLYFNT